MRQNVITSPAGNYLACGSEMQHQTGCNDPSFPSVFNG